MWTESGNLVLGVVLLVLGNDSLANGLSGLFARKGSEVYPVALASALATALLPALAILLAALAMGEHEQALGGLLGGAVAQLALLLGLAALAAPLLSRLQVLNWLMPALPLAILLAWALGLDERYSRVDGAILLAAFGVLCVLVLRAAASERPAVRSLFAQSARHFGLPLLVVRLLVGAALLALGAWRLLLGSTALAESLVLNPLIIGLLVLGPAAALAGLPAAILAARRGNSDFALAQGLFGALGNVLALLGGLLIWQALATPVSLGRIEWPILFALAVATPLMRTDGELSRREGAMLLVTYLVFVAFELWLTGS